MLEHLIDLCARHGVSDVVLSTGHLSGVVSQFFGDGRSFGVRIHYVQENRPLGTAGALRLAAPLLDRRFFLLFGDVVSDMRLDRFEAAHAQWRALATLAVQPSPYPYDSHMIRVADGGRIDAFLGKPRPGLPFENMSFAPFFVMERRILSYLPEREACDVVHDLLPRALAAGERLMAFRTDDRILDMGTPERLATARREFSARPKQDP